MQIILIIILFIAVFTIIQNNIPVVRKVKISNPDLQGIKIVQLSDLHRKKFGDMNSMLISKLKKLSPSMIMLTGDMVTRKKTDLKPLENLLSASSRLCPVYYALGNHEIDMEPNEYEKLMDIIKRSRVTLLKNQSADILINEKSLHITGLCFERENFRNRYGKFSGLKPYLIKDINEAVGIKERKYTILLAHNPIYMDTYASWGADLVLSGHVHGGIVRIPFLKGILSPERKFFPEYSAGMYYKDNTMMYVNCGLGKFRLFNPPEITLFEFV